MTFLSDTHTDSIISRLAEMASQSALFVTTCMFLQLICYLSVQAANTTAVGQGFGEKQHQPTLNDLLVSQEDAITC